MRAIVKPAPASGIELQEVDEPHPDATEVLLRIEAASVCGTDLGLAHWTRSAQDFEPNLPLILGHECAGIIVGLGGTDHNWSIGQRVAVESHFFCGRCAACTAGAAHNCLRMRIPGITAPGAFAEYMTAPASACFALREGVEPAVGALYEPAGVAAHALEQAGDVRDKMVVITGAGPVGLFLIDLLRAAGAGPIAVVEPGLERRGRAERLQAKGFDTGDIEDLIAYCREHGTVAGADIAFEASGAVRAYTTIFEVLGRDGTLVSVGHPSRPLEIDVSRDINKRAITWKGVFGRRIWSSWEYLDELVTSGRIDLVSHVELELGLEELPDRLDEVASLPGKAIVRP